MMPRMSDSETRKGLRSHAATRGALAAMLVLLLPAGPSAAETVLRHRVVHLRPVRVAARPLVVHRRVARVAPVPDVAVRSVDPVPAFHGWNDPDLESFGGWRFGGDIFYGDQEGDPITRGNAGLGMIAGYGPARGGFGGPHFDAVGGFHNGPGPDAQEAADYATGQIWRPDYGGIVPTYPSPRQRVALLDRGVPMARPIRATLRTAPPPLPRPLPAPQRAEPADDDPFDF